MKVSIVIPNWNGADLMRRHLPKVLSAAPKTEIIVSDDQSTDGSVDYIHKNFPGIIVVEGQRHNGFASTVNAGVARAHGDIVVLLNTDVEPRVGFLESLTPHFSDPDVFAVGCLDKSVERGSEVQRGRGVGRWIKGFFIHSRGEVNKPDTAWVAGGSGAFRKSMWNKLGGMDTLFNPFYWEDVDLSYRARKAGWKTLFAPSAVVFHYHEEGKIKREFTPARIKTIAYRNQFIFIWKNATDMQVLLAHALWTPIRLLRALFTGDVSMMEGYILALLKLPRVILHRRAAIRLFKKQDSELAILN